MRLRWWRRSPEDEELRLARERVERTAKIIEQEREAAAAVVDFLKCELEVNHFAERVRWAFKEDPTR